MKDLKTVVKDIERDLVIGITLSVKYGRINLIQAREIAKEFMAGYPYKNKNDLFRKIDFLSDKYKLVRKVYVKHVEDFETEKTERVLSNMRGFMKKNNLDMAIRVAKKGIYG